MNKAAFCDLSIPLRFNEAQPNAYGVRSAIGEACEYGDLVGDTRRGGSVNFESYTFIPHCNGTHTECVGHITDERISVRECLKDIVVPAVLITVTPEVVNGESVITKRSLLEPKLLSENIKNIDKPYALIVRTLPNDDSKLSQLYGTDDVGSIKIPPYFAADAMHFMVENGVQHLLCDMPSIDRIYDDGKLENHRIFWNVEPGSRAVGPDTRVNCTITELIYVPSVVADGKYLLNLQIAPFEADASPSRPVIFSE